MRPPSPHPSLTLWTSDHAVALLPFKHIICPPLKSVFFLKKFEVTLSSTLLRSALTCSFLADVGQIIVAGHVVPFAVLMGNHYHAVLSTGEKIVGLVFAPVLILLHTYTHTNTHIKDKKRD